MDDEGIKPGNAHEGVLWVESDLPLRTIYRDDDGADYDVTHIRLRYEVIEAAKRQEKVYAKYLADEGHEGASANLLTYRVACTDTNIAVQALIATEGRE